MQRSCVAGATRATAKEMPNSVIKLLSYLIGDIGPPIEDYYITKMKKNRTSTRRLP